jgi:anti-anti-sigma factor
MKIEFEIKNLHNRSTLEVQGDLVAQNAAEFKAKLQSLHDEKGELQLSLKGAKSIDVSGVQLVKSFKQFAASSHRDLQIIPPDSDEVIHLLAKTGLFSILQPDTHLKFNTKQ